MPAADARPSLEPLRCPPCGSPVPMGVRDVARCPACGTEVEVPAAHRALRDAARVDDEARQQAEAVAAELARPATLAMRFWIAAGHLAMSFALLMVLAWLVVSLVMCIGNFIDAGLIGAVVSLLIGFVLGVPLLYDETLHGLAPPLGVDLADVLGGAGAYGLLGLLFWGVTVVPLSLGAYAESFESVRTALRTALAADPAAMPGGPAQCRSCGAALDEHPEALHVRCLYCGSDNLVHLPTDRLGTLAQAIRDACRDLQAALAQEQHTARTGRTVATRRLLWWLALVPVCILLGRAVAGVNENGHTFWHRAVASAPMVPHQADNTLLPAGAATLFDVHDTFDGCDDERCWAYYYVALGAGQRVHVTAEGGELFVMGLATRRVGTWYDPTYHWEAIDMEAGVPYRGWYRVALATAKARGREMQVTWAAVP